MVLKPAEYEADMRGIPPKIHIMGRDGEEIGIAFSGHMRTAMDFAGKLKYKRKHPFGDNTRSIHDVAQNVEQSHRKTIQEQFAGVDQGDFNHYAADARNIYAVKIGRSKINERGQQVPDDPYVWTLQGHLYSMGVNEVALRYLAPHFGYANLPFQQQQPLQMKTLSLADAKQHVIKAMRLNAQDDASRGHFSVSENFDAYIFTPGGKAVYWEHEPPLDPRTKARLERQVSPIETMKKLIRHGLWNDEMPGRIQLSEQQREWRNIAMRELALERGLELRRSRGNLPESTYIGSSSLSTGGSEKMHGRKHSPSPTGREPMQHLPNRKRSNPHKNKFTHANRRQMRGKKKLGLKSPPTISKRARGGK